MDIAVTVTPAAFVANVALPPTSQILRDFDFPCMPLQSIPLAIDALHI